MSAPSTGAGAVHVVSIDDAGIHLQAADDLPVDVLFDGRRIFSFWSHRDSRRSDGEWFFPWPGNLRRFLDGSTTVALVDHVGGEMLHEVEVSLGDGEGRIAVEDAQGNPMGLDKSMRLSRLFDSRSAEHLEPLLDAIGTVLGAVEEAGLEPFLAYGTLLGAVREGTFIGHDSDADIGYVSSHDHPFDVVLESFRVQRRLLEMGYEIHRYSGLAFKVVVRESDGSPRGLDVFGGFMLDGNLYLMGEVGHPFRREWIEPRSEVTLAGRAFPAPAQPEHLLEAMYGESWQVPDPAFKFSTPHSASRRLNGWFRGTRVGLDAKWARFSRGAREARPSGPSAFVQWVREREPDVATAVDIGCGTGGDVLWLAAQGIHSLGVDYFPRGFRDADHRARKKGLDARFEWTNLSQLRSVFATGAVLAREPGPRIALARHVADSTDLAGRENLLRLARLTVGHTGRLHLQAHLPHRDAMDERSVSLDELVARSGGTVEEDHRLADDTVDVLPAPTGPPTLRRMVIAWHRRP